MDDSNILQIDIQYWACLQQVPILQHLFKYEIPAHYKNLCAWLERLDQYVLFLIEVPRLQHSSC